MKMTTAQVVETSVTVTKSSFQNYTHPDDHTRRTTDTPGFKSFTMIDPEVYFTNKNSRVFRQNFTTSAKSYLKVLSYHLQKPGISQLS